MVATEDSGEIGGVTDPDAAGDLGDRQLGPVEQGAGFGHPSFDDPLLHRAPGAPAYHGGQMSGSQPEFGGHVAQGQWLAHAALDQGEHLGDQRLATAPKIRGHIVDVDGGHHLPDRLPELLRSTGFDCVTFPSHRLRLFGPVAFYRATRPDRG